jgi:hypothetical protein
VDAQGSSENGVGRARGAWLANHEAQAPPLLGAVKTTAVKTLQLDHRTDGCLVGIETDAGVTGCGETGADAKMARAHSRSRSSNSRGDRAWSWRSTRRT